MSSRHGPFDTFTGAMTSLTSKAPSLEVVLDERWILFRGTEHETGPQKFSGTVIVTTEAPLRPRSFTVEFTGEQYTSHNVTRGDRFEGYSGEKKRFSNTIQMPTDSVTIHDEHGHAIDMIHPGTHRYTFSMELRGDTLESFEGVPDDEMFRKYWVTARLNLPRFQKNVKARRKVRVVRTLGGDISEWMFPHGQSGAWPEKIKYGVNMPSFANVYGSKVKVDFELTPLADKLSVSKIIFDIREKRGVRTEPGPQDYPAMEFKLWKTQTEHICPQVKEIPPDSQDTDPELDLPRLKFSLTYDLPKSMRSIRQSNDRGSWIQVKHECTYNILMKNADGHTSELKVYHGIHLFVSPTLPINDNGFIDQSARQAMQQLDVTANYTANPPLYEEHSKDMPLDPFSDLASAMATPGLRSGSVTPGRDPESAEGGAITSSGPSAETLRARLANLSVQDRGFVFDEDTQRYRRRSEGGAEHIQYSNFDMAALSRVPSYSTAMDSSLPQSDLTHTVPSYHTATSRPSSRPQSPPDPESPTALNSTHNRRSPTDGCPNA